MSKNVKQCSSSFYCDKYGDPYRIEIDLIDETGAENIFYDSCGEPEDNDYGRDHNDVLNVPALLQKFYQMGRNDEVILFSETDLINENR